MNLAIIGATGNVGRKTIEILEKSKIKISNLFLVASEKSEGKKNPGSPWILGFVRKATYATLSSKFECDSSARPPPGRRIMVKERLQKAVVSVLMMILVLLVSEISLPCNGKGLVPIHPKR